MMIEDVIKKSILPLAFILFWFWIVSTIMKVSGKTDLFWWIFLSGLPFGIHKMRLILIPKGMDITATLADEMKQEELEKDECYGCAYGKCGPCIGMKSKRLRNRDMSGQKM